MSVKRRLVLIRHAKSDYPSGVPDHDRPLSTRGRRDAPAIGEWLTGHVSLADVRRPMVLVSTAVRAQQTWTLAAACLGPVWSHRLTRDEPRIYEAGPHALLDIIGSTPGDVDVLVVVGHNPGVAALVESMCASTSLVDEATAKFPTSAIAVIEGVVGWGDAPSWAGDLRLAAFTVPRG